MKSVGILLRQLRETGRAQLAISRGKERNYGKKSRKVQPEQRKHGGFTYAPGMYLGRIRGNFPGGELFF